MFALSGKVLDMTLPCIWESLHRYLEEFPSWIHLEERNDDLAGFFNSVPRQMILASLDLLAKQYQDTTLAQLFTVDLRKGTASAERALPHKPRGVLFAQCESELIVYLETCPLSHPM